MTQPAAARRFQFTIPADAPLKDLLPAAPVTVRSRGTPTTLAGVRQIVKQSLAPPPAPTSGAGEPVDGTTSAPSSTSAAPPSPGTTAGPTTDPVADVQDACAYDPKQAAEARAQGKPPTKTGR